MMERLSGRSVLASFAAQYRWLISQRYSREQFTRDWHYSYERMEAALSAPTDEETDELIRDSESEEFDDDIDDSE